MSPRNSGDRARETVFYGRGGAGKLTQKAVDLPGHADWLLGNANKNVTQNPPPELDTPTLKSKTYTTGRGGSGNMAVNDPEHPELARERQDVDMPHVPLVAEKNFQTGRGK